MHFLNQLIIMRTYIIRQADLLISEVTCVKCTGRKEYMGGILLSEAGIDRLTLRLHVGKKQKKRYTATAQMQMFPYASLHGRV